MIDTICRRGPSSLQTEEKGTPATDGDGDEGFAPAALLNRRDPEGIRATVGGPYTR